MTMVTSGCGVLVGAMGAKSTLCTVCAKNQGLVPFLVFTLLDTEYQMLSITINTKLNRVFVTGNRAVIGQDMVVQCDEGKAMSVARDLYTYTDTHNITVIDEQIACKLNSMVEVVDYKGGMY
jgi:hypothetical protein